MLRCWSRDDLVSLVLPADVFALAESFSPASPMGNHQVGEIRAHKDAKNDSRDPDCFDIKNRFREIAMLISWRRRRGSHSKPRGLISFCDMTTRRSTWNNGRKPPTHIERE
jgi:hypothetical protein